MLKPQDLLILLKISDLQIKKQTWQQKDLASALFISGAEISLGIKRCSDSYLLDIAAKEVIFANLLEVLIYGVRYFFPTKLAGKARGIPTAWGVSPLKDKLSTQDLLPVWPHPNGEISGLSVEPLYKTVADIAIKEPNMHLLLSLVDALRIGKVRERNLAKNELLTRLKM